MKSRSIFLALLCLFILSGCKVYSDPQMYHTYEPRAIAAEAGDIYVMRIQGKGSTRENAIDNALLQAVKDVIFKDIQVTYGDHKSLMRLINNPLEEQKNSEFFENFFSPNGAYKRFITPEQKNREFFSSSTSQIVLLNAKIDRRALRDYLRDMGII